jgi:hypothetical protein
MLTKDEARRIAANSAADRRMATALRSGAATTGEGLENKKVGH